MCVCGGGSYISNHLNIKHFLGYFKKHVQCNNCFCVKGEAFRGIHTTLSKPLGWVISIKLCFHNV